MINILMNQKPGLTDIPLYLLEFVCQNGQLLIRYKTKQWVEWGQRFIGRK